MSIEESIFEAKEEIRRLKESIDDRKEQFEDISLGDISSFVEDLGESSIEVRRELRGHLGKVYAVDWARDSKTILSAAQDGKIIIWDAYIDTKLEAISLRQNWVMTASFSPNMKFIASGGLDNVCTIYDIGNLDDEAEEPPQVHRELNSHTGYVSSTIFIGESEILTSSGDMSCILWDIETGQKKTEFADHNGDVMSIDISPQDVQTFISGGCDATAKLWDIRSGNCESTFEGHQSDINNVCFFPDGYAFGTGSDDASCRLFDLRIGKQLMEYTDDDILCGISSIDFSKSGRLLFGGYDDFTCHVWDVLKGKEVAHLESHTNRVSCLKVSTDGNALLTGSWDKELRVWA